MEALNVGGWLTHGDTASETSADFLAVSERRLIPARVWGEWACVELVFTLFGLQLPRRFLMLVMQVLGLSA